MKVKKLLSTVLATGAFTTALMAPAGAATLYENHNYEGGHLSTTNTGYVGWINDKTSSVKLYSGEKRTFFEDSNYTGRHFVADTSYNRLRNLKGWGLKRGETWDDRISSVK